MIFPHISEILIKILAEKAENGILILGIILSLPLAVQTFINNAYWKNEIALWQHNVEIDPSSSFSFMQYGAALEQAKKYDEAIEAFNRSLDNRSTALGLMGRARANINLGNYEEAVWDLQTVVEMPNENINAYTLYQTYEALALALSSSGKNDRAESILRDARKRLPIYHAALTEKIAIILYQQNRKTEALKELENAQTQSRRELLPESKNIFLRLGMLYAESGQKEKVRNAFQEYLKLTNGFNDAETVKNRQQVAEFLRKLN